MLWPEFGLTSLEGTYLLMEGLSRATYLVWSAEKTGRYSDVLESLWGEPDEGRRK